MKKISGTEKIGLLLARLEMAEKILQRLGIDISQTDLSLVEACRMAKIPLQIALNNLSKATGIQVEWPQVKGMGDKSVFEASTGLKQGKPEGIKKLIAVHSGKGGVGKTFMAIGLALFLAEKGKKVGLLDLDIDCPNIPKTLGLQSKLITNKQKKIIPMEFRGIKIISMAGIQEREDLAILWRGPIISKAIEQMLHDTEWGELDILIADLPPGTSDAPLTLFNLLKPEGVLIVSTPQLTAQTDAAKSIDMCRSLKVPIIGLVENMTGEIFGQANAIKMTKKLEVDYLGELQLKADYNRAGFWNQKLEMKLNSLMKKISKKVFN